MQEKTNLEIMGTSQQPDVEGEDAASYDIDMAHYPLDSLLIRSETRTIHDVHRRMEKEHYVMDPDFQRSFVWNRNKQSKLIESILMRIPLPVFYLAEDSEGRIIVIDGLQRLTTIQRYLNDEFSLNNVGSEHEALKGKKFRDLSIKLQNRIEDTQLILYLLDEKVPDRAKFDIFQRVNEGTPLTRQQMRNCIYSGAATRLLKELAETEAFLTATAGGLSSKSMRDREVINRFLAFQFLPIDAYKGDMDAFLAEVLTKINNNPTLLQESELKKNFLRSMRNNFSVWGIHAFRKHAEGQEGRNVINIALFDVLAYAFARIPEDACMAYAAECRENLLKLFHDETFYYSITHSTNDVKNVSARFSLIRNIFPEELQCYIQ